MDNQEKKVAIEVSVMAVKESLERNFTRDELGLFVAKLAMAVGMDCQDDGSVENRMVIYTNIPWDDLNK